MRKACFRTLFLLFSVLFLVGSSFAQPVPWNHDPASDIGPNFWGELTPAFRTCGAIIPGFEGFQETGKKQSPIDVVTPVPASLPPLVFQYANTPLEVENNGHVIEVPYEPGNFLRIGSDTYELLQFHFHAPSEHTINGRFADMELHLVHRNFLGDLAVVGILMTVGPDPNPVVDKIMANEGAVTVPGAVINARDLLPKFRSYYLYSGSLTTPPCSEGVRWQVLKEPVQVSQFAVDRLHEIIGLFPEYDGFPDNNRPVRPLNGRTVFERMGR